MKTPDEIKKGLEEEIPVHYHIDGEPRLTPRMLMDMQWLHKDALALIQRLQAENAEKDARIQQLEAERDAIMQDMNKNCTSCKHSGMNNPDNPCYKFEEQCRDYSKWEWRGVQKEG
jgi:protease II